MKVTGEVKVLKDDKGIYRLALANKELNENGEEQSIFMKIHVGFKRGQEVKNRTKIDIKNGFLTFFRIKTEETYEDGKTIYRNFPKLMILDYEVIEDGVDEVQKTRDYSNAQNNFNNDVFGGYSSDDDLPF